MATLYETIEELCRLNEMNVTYMCRECGASRSSLTDLKKGRSSTLTAETLDRIARYFHVSIDFLLDEDDEKFVFLGQGDAYERSRASYEKEPSADDDEELWEIRQAMKDRAELKTLFHLSKNATPAEVRKMLKVLQLIKEDDENVD